MTQEEYLAQFNNMSDYFDAVRRDYSDEFGEPMPMDMKLLAYKIGLQHYEPEKYERLYS